MPMLLKLFFAGFIPFTLAVLALDVFVQWMSQATGVYPDHVVHAILGAAVVAYLFDRPTPAHDREEGLS